MGQVTDNRASSKLREDVHREEKERKRVTSEKLFLILNPRLYLNVIMLRFSQKYFWLHFLFSHAFMFFQACTFWSHFGNQHKPDNLPKLQIRVVDRGCIALR